MAQQQADDERIAYYSRVTEDAARQSSETEVQAIEAEREWVLYKMCEYMEDKLGQVLMRLYRPLPPSVCLFSSQIWSKG